MPQHFKGTLRGRLLALILLIFIPVFGYAVYDAVHEFQRRSASSEENLRRLSRLLAQDHLQYIGTAKQSLKVVIRVLEASQGRVKDCSALLTQLTQDLPNFVEFGIASIEGEVICTSVPGKIKNNISSLPFFKAVMATRRSALGPYEIDRQTNKATVYIGGPIIDAEHKLSFVVFGALDLSHFDNVSSLLQFPEQSVLVVFDNHGLVLARYPDPYNWTGTVQPVGGLMGRMPSNFNEGFWEAQGLDNIMRLYAVKNIHRIEDKGNNQEVYIALGIPSDHVYNTAINDLVGKVLSLVTVLLFTGFIVWIGGDFLIVQKMGRLIEAADRVRGGDLQARTGLKGGADEIGRLAEAFDDMAESMKQRVEALQKYGFEMKKLKEMTESLQSCLNHGEVVTTARYFGEQLFPDFAGGIYLMVNGNDAFQLKTAWGTSSLKREFLLEDCWAARRGRLYFSHTDGSEPLCHHLTEPPPRSYVCIPLIGGGEISGMFHLEKNEPIFLDDKAPVFLSLAESFAEHLSLMLASIDLRETLHAQAMRDGLTGLFNRRFMEESLNREIRNAERNGSTVALIMADIDHFKHFNDTYGHAAGDELLREYARMFQAHLRGSDLACRYGGEEFTIILPGASLDQAADIADVLRCDATTIRISTKNQSIESTTISLGVACYPQHGDSWEKALYAADIALLRAKQRRNAFVIYEET